MQRPSPGHAALEAAANWLATLCADDRTADDEAAFQTWLSADPRHATAFEAIHATWDSVGALPRGEIAIGKVKLHRRAMIMGSLGALMALSGGLTLLDRTGEVYQTEVGERKHLVLHDGSNVLLDTDTRLRVDFTDRVRTVELDHGRANFNIVADAKRIFSVKAADDLVVGDRSNFDVRRDVSSLSVLLLRGRVSVKAANAETGGIHVLDSGQRLRVSDASLQIDRPDLASLTAWQTGQLIFDSSTLISAIGEMNRYSHTKLEIDDARIAGMKVSGVFRAGDNAGFARALSRLLPIEAKVSDDRIGLTANEARLIEG